MQAGEGHRGAVQVTSVVSLRALSSGDMDMLIRWFSVPHVARWWEVQPDEARRQKYEARLRPTAPVDVFIIEAHGAPIGMLQAVYGAETNTEGDCGLDILIGDETALGKGYASASIAYFVEHTGLHRHRIARFIADPDVANTASIRTFERAGFAATSLPEGMRWIRSVEDPRH
jgi:acetyl CoA:N6-hydroxylysine acetyl transferase